MKAMQFDEYGPPEVLHPRRRRASRTPGPGQIRIRVHAAGVNPVDWKIRGGTSRRAIPVQLPSIPGLEAAGIVDELGPDVTGVSVGDEVFGSAISGAAAEHTVLDHWAAKPAAMSWAEAGGLSMAVETAARGLDLLSGPTGDLSGRTILISGAAGGRGHRDRATRRRPRRDRHRHRGRGQPGLPALDRRCGHHLRPRPGRAGPRTRTTWRRRSHRRRRARGAR